MSDKETAAVCQPEDHEEVARRLPSIHLIDPYRSFQIQEEVARLTCEAPVYFWNEPASKSGHHHPICRQERGLWAHTLMLSTIIERWRDAIVECRVLTHREVDLIHAACILHDQRKNGDPEDPHHKSVGDHDLQMARVIREESSLPEKVAQGVEAHMSAWYDGPQPANMFQWIIAFADLVSSTESNTPAVPAPLPDELQGMGLTEVDL